MGNISMPALPLSIIDVTKTTSSINVLSSSFVGAATVEGFLNLILQYYDISVVIKDSIFSLNQAQVGSGAISFWNPIASNIQILDCTFVNNSALV